jgi:hypothetical protein
LDELDGSRRAIRVLAWPRSDDVDAVCLVQDIARNRVADVVDRFNIPVIGKQRQTDRQTT